MNNGGISRAKRTRPSPAMPTSSPMLPIVCGDRRVEVGEEGVEEGVAYSLIRWGGRKKGSEGLGGYEPSCSIVVVVVVTHG